MAKRKTTHATLRPNGSVTIGTLERLGFAKTIIGKEPEPSATAAENSEGNRQDGDETCRNTSK